MQFCILSQRLRAAPEIRMAVALASSLLLFGCSAQESSTSNDLVGQWQCIDRPWTLKFTLDGQVAWKEVGPVFGGQYSWNPRGDLEVQLNNGDQFSAAVQIDGNQELTWNGSDGSQGRFRRVR